MFFFVQSQFLNEVVVNAVGNTAFIDGVNPIALFVGQRGLLLL